MAVLKKKNTAAALKKYLLRKCNCCVDVVTLKNCEKSSLSKNKAVLKKSQHMRERKLLFELKKHKQIRLVITFNKNYFPERSPHPGKYSYEIPHEYWLEPTEEKIIRLCLCHTILINFQSCMYHKLKKCLDCRSSHQRCSIEKAVYKNFLWNLAV